MQRAIFHSINESDTMKDLDFHNMQHRTAEQGFTLIEVLITLVISMFIMAAVYSAYIAQQHQYTNQTQVIKMQQNIRAVVSFMKDELRMVGYDPTGSANAGFVSAAINRVQFTKDITNSTGTADDGDSALDGPFENIVLGFRDADDANNDGIADSGAASIFVRTDPGATFSEIADDIHAIEFSYILNNSPPTTTTSPAVPYQIDSVTISILARASKPDHNFTNNLVYTTGAGNSWGPFGDNYRRRLIVANVKCRNLGL